MNGIYTHLALKELKNLIINRFIQRISVRERLIQIEFDEDSMFISLYPEALGFYINQRIKNFDKLTFYDDYLSGARIVDIEQDGYKPVFNLVVEKVEYNQKKKIRLCISLYKEAPNLSIITDGFRRSLFSKYIEKGQKKSILEIGPDALKDKDLLIREYEGIDKFLAQELNKENLEILKNILKSDICKPRIVSIIPLRISLFSEDFLFKYNSWNSTFKDGIRMFLEEREKIAIEHRRKKQVSKIEKEIEELNRRLEKKESLETYRIAGELILMNIAKIKKGMESIRLFNPYDNKDIEIKLDPKKTPKENAEDYFKEYKKLKRGIPKILERIKKLQKEIEILKQGGEIEKEKKSTKVQSEKSGEKKSLPFREFTLESGSKVYVGKDARSNMELTFKFARPDDYFFHIRGYEGAHTILRPMLRKGQNVSKEDIVKSAAIAAYFSKAKNQKNVAVSYTQRKYIKKAKNSKLGSVVLMREEVIFVDPGLPSNTEEGD
jgi:predicted ribosome quality control (RQC) complex YloA/Tae2 family protein